MIVNGRFVVRDRRVTTVDTSGLRARVAAAVGRVLTLHERGVHSTARRRLAERLLTLGVADASALQAIDDEATDEIADSIEFAERSPLAAPESGLTHVYV